MSETIPTGEIIDIIIAVAILWMVVWPLFWGSFKVWRKNMKERNDKRRDTF